MMRKILILVLGALSFGVIAQTAQEEAIILNQELQFLEDSISNTQAMSINTTNTDADRNRAINEDSLERTYFEETEEDSISTRTASPKRRSY